MPTERLTFDFITRTVIGPTRPMPITPAQDLVPVAANRTPNPENQSGQDQK
jgi:hypothetical protein